MEGSGASIHAVRLDEYFKVGQSAIGLPELAEEREQSVVVEQKVADRLGSGHGVSLDDQSVSIPAQIWQEGQHSQCAPLWIGFRYGELSRLSFLRVAVDEAVRVVGPITRSNEI